MTFSIVARCASTGRFGVAVCSSSPAVGARCAFARAGVGAAASQNLTDPRLGEMALDALAAGQDPQDTLDRLVAGQPHRDHRQLLVVDAHGATAAFSGAHTLGLHAVAKTSNAAAAGNLLANEGVPAAMIEAFTTAGGTLGERLLTAMRAGLKAGGEAGPVHSAGMRIVDALPWPWADLRVDWAEDDVLGRLEALWTLYAPQADAYVQRALDPSAAPRFGVAGDR
jgi:uncharacterized Ntn-hydrolase superfamily protein